jgi:hypothetical protein
MCYEFEPHASVPKSVRHHPLLKLKAEMLGASRKGPSASATFKNLAQPQNCFRLFDLHLVSRLSKTLEAAPFLTTKQLEDSAIPFLGE